MNNEQTITNVAKTLNVTPEALKERVAILLEEQGPAWTNAGKSEDDCELLAIRVAARQINTEAARLRRAGAEAIEGMFIHSPRPKEWGKILYNKMSKQLRTADEGARTALVESGAVVLFENNHDGTWTKMARDDFGGQSDVTELPRNTMNIDENTSFFVVWDKSNPTFPSGDANFKFGKARPQDERERTSLFLTTDMKLVTIKAQGKAADIQHPTFVTGTIPVRMGQNGTTAYCKPEVSVFTTDESLSNKYPSAPIDLLGMEDIPVDMLDGFDALTSYYDTHNGQPGWWDKIVAVPSEVIHIDPRDNGGMVLVCADLDITSTAPTVDVYVGADHPVDFAVGTKCLIVGQTWRSQENEQRMSVGGWWAYDMIESMDMESNLDAHSESIGVMEMKDYE